MQQEGNIRLNELPDEELIDRFRYSHNNQYVGELYKRYSHLVLGLCIKYFKDIDVAKDAVMSIFELLLQELKRHKIDNFKSWLYIVSKNYCLQELRKTNSNSQKEELYKVFIEETMENEVDLHLKVEQEKWLKKMEKALPTLKHNQGQCLKMFYLEGKSYADISKELNFSLNDVKSHIQNGKRNLKIKLLENNV